MGKLIVLKASPLATIQDFGRYGFRRYGIPQCGAMDKGWMIAANNQVANHGSNPVIEYAISAMILQAEEATTVALVGAQLLINSKPAPSIAKLAAGDILTLAKPTNNYAYLAIKGLIRAQEDFKSYSTDLRAGFGGLNGRAIKKGDLLIAEEQEETDQKSTGAVTQREQKKVTNIRIMKGPEWGLLKEIPESRPFIIDPSSDRMGIRLTGTNLEFDFHEITSSAVVPGTIQLPPDGQPIILMNDCQTTGGYPRIGKVLDKELGKLAQINPGDHIRLVL